MEPIKEPTKTPINRTPDFYVVTGGVAAPGLSGCVAYDGSLCKNVYKVGDHFYMVERTYNIP